MKMQVQIKKKIQELKNRHHYVSNTLWITPTNGLNKRGTLFKIESQVEVLEELLNLYTDKDE